MYSRSGRRMSKRSYIDVGFYPGSTDDKDPVELFVCMVRNKYKKGTEKVQKLNKELLEDLISRGHIPKSNIVWNPHNDSISRIYGFKVDNEGYIQYDTSGSNSPNRNYKKERVETERSYIDISALRNAIVRSKEIAI